MIIYCDTSVMLSAFASETHSEAVRNWLGRYADSIAISDWVVTEFSGALAMKRRMAAIDQNTWSIVMRDWRHFLTRGLRIERLAPRNFARAALIMERPDVKLRSSDALHLALAEDRRFAIATLDHHFGDAAESLGITLDRVLA